MAAKKKAVTKPKKVKASDEGAIHEALVQVDFDATVAAQAKADKENK